MYLFIYLCTHKILLLKVDKTELELIIHFQNKFKLILLIVNLNSKNVYFQSKHPLLKRNQQTKV